MAGAAGGGAGAGTARGAGGGAARGGAAGGAGAEVGAAMGPEKRQNGLRDGTLPQLFKDEIEKSWLEYVEQVGRDLAESTPFWTEGLNEILAGGKKLF